MIYVSQVSDPSHARTTPTLIVKHIISHPRASCGFKATQIAALQTV